MLAGRDDLNLSNVVGRFPDFNFTHCNRSHKGLLSSYFSVCCKIKHFNLFLLTIRPLSS